MIISWCYFKIDYIHSIKIVSNYIKWKKIRNDNNVFLQEYFKNTKEKVSLDSMFGKKGISQLSGAMLNCERDGCIFNSFLGKWNFFI